MGTSPVVTRAVRVTPAALRAVRAGHPWVYADAIRSVKGQADPGDIGVVFDPKNRLAAVGLLDPTSAIGLRVLATESTTIDPAWLRERIKVAAAGRKPLQPLNTGMRLVNGEGDRLPGLIIDHYDDLVVVKVYTLGWVRYLDWIRTVLEVDYPRGVLRYANQVTRSGTGIRPDQVAGWRDPGRWWGEVGDGEVTFVENGLTMGANVLHGHKTGHFFDQRANRRRAAALSTGGPMLDVFACTGGFGLHAAAAGAGPVTLVDLAQPALEAAQTNFALNQLDPPRIEVGDGFERLADQPGGHFDLVVVDPPTFAVRQRQLNRALEGYRRLAELAWRCLRPGGHLVQASCSTHVTADQLRDAVVSATGSDLVVWESAHDLDHPVLHREGSYLKALAVAKGA